MSMDASLFGDEPADEEVAPQAPLAVADWQVGLLRKALDGRELTEMAQRQQLIESLAGRPVASLRELTADEAMSLLAELGRTPSSTPPTGSTWDDREEDTWIDRL